MGIIFADMMQKPCEIGMCVYQMYIVIMSILNNKVHD